MDSSGLFALSESESLAADKRFPVNGHLLGIFTLEKSTGTSSVAELGESLWL